MDTYLSGRILDIGCGTGRTTAYMAKKFDVVGIDYSEAMIERAKRNHPSFDLRVMDVRQLDFPDSYFDGAFFSFNGIDYLYPFEERLRALREIHRVLKIGGIFAYTSNLQRRGISFRPRHIVSELYALAHSVKKPYMVTHAPFGFLITYCAPVEEQIAILEKVGFECVEHFPEKRTAEMFIARKK